MSKIEEANEHIRQAEKALKPTLLKWRPDYEVAADEYSHAATCFRIAKSYAQCKDCLVKAADCYKQTKAWFHAAKSIEQALLICKEMGDLSEVSKLAHSACSLFQQHGSPESGVNALDKAAKMLEATQPQQALELFKRAADIIMGEDSPRHAAEYMSKAARLLVKLQMYDEAADAIRREIGMYQEIKLWQSLGRLTVALVLVQLARGDQVAAEKAFKEWGNYCEPPEVQTLETLLQAYDNEDANAARAALNSPFIKHMDVEYAKLARGLPLPQQEYAVPPAGIRANAAESYVSPNVSKPAEAEEKNDATNQATKKVAEKKPEVAPPPESQPAQKEEEGDDECTSVKNKLDEMRDKSGTMTVDTALDLLQAAAAEIEEESETIAEKFLAGDIEVDEFLDQFLSRRKFMHLRKVKVDKLRELIRKGHSSNNTPGYPIASNFPGITPSIPYPTGPVAMPMPLPSGLPVYRPF